MDCLKHQAQFSAHLDGDLSQEERKAMQSHLKECLLCYRKWSSLQKTHGALSRLPDLDPPEHLSALVMARLKERRLHQHPWIFAGLPRWLPLGVGAALLLLISLTIWQLMPSPSTLPMQSQAVTEDQKSVITRTGPSGQPMATVTTTKRKLGHSNPVMVLKVKDFSRVDQQLEAMLRAFSQSMAPEQQSARSVRSSSARLIDVQVPGQQFQDLIRELHKIGHLDPGQVESHELSSHRQRQAISIRIIVVSNGTDTEVLKQVHSEPNQEQNPGQDESGK